MSESISVQRGIEYASRAVEYGMTNETLQSRDKWTLACLAGLAATYGGDANTLQLPLDDLCRYVGVTAPTLRRSLHELEAEGFITTIGRTADSGTTIRRINLEEIVV